MAKTPLFSQLRRLLISAVPAQGSQEPLSAASLRRRAWSRRAFLQVSGAVVASTSLAACAGGGGKSEMPSDLRVAVVGAGLAGLHCAWRLQEAGINVTVFESSNRFGGRTFSARNINANGQLCELGGELIDTDHLAMHELAKQLGITLDDRKLALAVPGDLYWIANTEIPEAVILTQFQAVAPLMVQALGQADSDDTVFATLDAMSLRAWLDANVGKTQNPELYHVLEVAYRGEYGLEIDEQSALNLIYLIGSDETSTFRIFGASDERYHTHTGNDTFAQEIATRIPGKILLEHQVAAASLVASGKIQLQVQTPQSLFVEVYDHVVFALPFTRLRQLDLNSLGLLPEKVKVIKELGYGTNAKVMGSFNERVWLTKYQREGSIISDAAFQQTWDTSRGQEGAMGILTNFLGGQQGVAVQGVDVEGWFAGTVVEGADGAFPGLKAAYVPGSAVRMHWPSYPHNLGSYGCYKPGQWASAGLEGVRQGKVHFCGEHTSENFQGYMEGAAESGAFAAYEILEDYGVPPSAGLTTVLQIKGKLTV